MGHFIITLTDNSIWDVKFGTVRRKAAFIDFFRKSKLHNDKRKGYIVTNKSERKEYRLLKKPGGEWTDREEAGFNIYNDETSISVKKAIDEFENKH